MHPKEARKERVGTGRLAHLAMTNSEIVIDKTFDDSKIISKIKNDNTIILYPGPDSCKTKRLNTLDTINLNRPLNVLLIDGTWPCAKSMMRDSYILHNIPKVSFQNTYQSKFSIKHQPDNFCLSTIESIYYFLDELNDLGIESLGDSHNILLTTLQKLVKIQKECAKDPLRKKYGRGFFKNPKERKTSINRNQRKIYFDKNNY